jgi:L-threonylcarbamoyladenylate synthase
MGPIYSGHHADNPHVLAMTIVRIDPVAPDPAILARAADLLRRGELVVFPTETVYGLGAHAMDARAVRRIYEAKGRPSYNPLIVHVADTEGARAVASAWPERAARLADAFWPGPLTIVLPKRAGVPDEVTAGLDTVGLRVPLHPIALALLREARLPIAAPSANRSTELSPTTAQHVAKALGDRVEMILDAGPTTVGIESTVVDISSDETVILRPGVLGPQELEPIVGRVRFADVRAEAARSGGPSGASSGTGSMADQTPRPSPGMMDKHYAPRARVLLFGAGEAGQAAAEARAMLEERRVVGGLLLHQFDVDAPHMVRMPSEPAAYARRLYETLHALDDAGCELIVVERVPEDVAWAGVRDRLERSAR